VILFVAGCNPNAVVIMGIIIHLIVHPLPVLERQAQTCGHVQPAGVGRQRVVIQFELTSVVVLLACRPERTLMMQVVELAVAHTEVVDNGLQLLAAVPHTVAREV
jgi:hypothetical protein